MKGNMNNTLPKLKAFKRTPSLGLSMWHLGSLTTNLAEKKENNGAFCLVEGTLAPVKRNYWSILALVVLASAGVFSTEAQPIEFSEVSLLVRAHESDPDIMQQVNSRKLLHPLTRQQEGLLKSQGANDALLRSLRDSSVALSPSQADALAAEQQLAARNRPTASDRREEDDSLGENVQVFDVSYGHPVNLGRWGGPDLEIAFNCRRFGDEEACAFACGSGDLIEPEITDGAGTYVDTATYLGQGRPDDSTTIFDRRNYVSVVAHESSRPISIDMTNPVSIRGVPYLLYPVYEARGICLYFIGKSGGGVRLAVVLPKH